MFDIAGSLAHAEMLNKQKIISTKDLNAIKKGLNQIKKEINKIQELNQKNKLIKTSDNKTK